MPLILLVGQVEKRDLRRNAFQEINYENMFRGVAKWVGEVTDPDQVPEYIARAFAMAMGGVPGPVVLSLPEDVLAMECARAAAAGDAAAPAAARPGRCRALGRPAARRRAADPAGRPRLRIRRGPRRAAGLRRGLGTARRRLLPPAGPVPQRPPALCRRPRAAESRRPARRLRREPTWCWRWARG